MVEFAPWDSLFSDPFFTLHSSAFYPRDGDFQTTLLSWLLLRFVQCEVLVEAQGALLMLPPGWTQLILYSYPGTTVSTSRAQFTIIQLEWPGDSPWSAFLNALQASEKETGVQPKKGADDISEQLHQHWKMSETCTSLL